MPVKKELRARAKAYEPPFTAEEIRRKFYLLGKMILPRGAAAFFAPLPKEPDLQRLAYEMRKRGSTLYPRVEGGELVFVPVENEGLLKKSSYGILEPEGEAYTGEISLIFVPGLMFSSGGKRLGRGKGYYDRALASFKGIKAGVCFEANLCDEIPMEAHDIAMDFVLTENRLIDCRSNYRGGA